MTPREIIALAWAITTKEKALRRWGFCSAIFETLRNVELILYQAYFLYMFWKGITVGWLSVEILFFESLPFWMFLSLTIFLIVLLILELFVPTMCQGAIIGLAAKSYRKEEVRGGLVLGLYNFFPILEIHGLFVLSSATLVFSACSMVLRYVEGEVKYAIMSMILLLWGIAALFRFFANFAEEGVVIRKIGVFDAVGRSFKLILSNMGHIVFLLILLVVITLRIFITALMIFLFPAIVIGIGLLLTLFLSHTISFIITSIVGTILLVVLSYFFAYLEVFKQTVWTLTYMELSKLKDVDIIED